MPKFIELNGAGFGPFLPHDLAVLPCSHLYHTMNERRLTRQLLLQANLDQYSDEIQGEVYQKSLNEQGHLGVTARHKVIMRLLCSAIDIVWPD